LLNSSRYSGYPFLVLTLVPGFISLGLRPSAPGFFLLSFYLFFLSTVPDLISLRLCSSTFEFGFVWHSEDQAG
jgi:hypothetical protein